MHAGYGRQVPDPFPADSWMMVCNIGAKRNQLRLVARFIHEHTVDRSELQGIIASRLETTSCD